ncbi:MAG: hypothetical protein H0U04_17210 [Rubrobacter sp.]|nr:hypothetical protein [Rubrobacter sp.]MDQ3302100.1 hypothetical protein [Actinomycetota bacterium]
MSGRPYDKDEIARRGKELYERRVREEVEAGGANEGRFLAIDVDSGDYEVGDDALGATAKLRRKKPDAVVYLMRVGRPTAFRLGGRFRAAQA